MPRTSKPKPKFPVRVNPALWRTDEVVVNGRRFGHVAPFVEVTEDEFAELEKLTQLGQGGADEETEHQLIVRVETGNGDASDKDAENDEGSQTNGEELA